MISSNPFLPQGKQETVNQDSSFPEEEKKIKKISSTYHNLADKINAVPQTNQLQTSSQIKRNFKQFSSSSNLHEISPQQQQASQKKIKMEEPNEQF